MLACVARIAIQSAVLEALQAPRTAFFAGQGLVEVNLDQEAMSLFPALCQYAGDKMCLAWYSTIAPITIVMIKQPQASEGSQDHS
ncbi:hypothetical protein QNH46_09740 [Paenibacillus woosongensis]|uniref:Uncharacterized protein n=1 Tax=Paenibacillus woosongensis TaxID=307580 RepID=A0AA95I7Y3_9BACL|nr:hypothetical protein [Paenibacillus woosongensis]WHX50896.1 hypothetical protein QNH46_09740 [Paenibacillus woosongensis]